MKYVRKVICLLLSGLMAASLAACGSDTTWAAKAGDNVMPAGVYILLQLEAIYNAEDTMAEEAADSESSETASSQPNVFKSTISGKSGEQYVNEKTQEYVKQYFAAEKKFSELGLSFTEDEQSRLNSSVEAAWMNAQTFYEKNGVGKNSVLLSVENYQKQDMIFEYTYGASGELSPSEEEYLEYYNKTRARLRYIPFSLQDESGQQLGEEEAKAVEEEANAYFERAKAGEDLEKLLNEYNEKVLGEELQDKTPGAYDAVMREGSNFPAKAVVDEMFSAPLNEVHLIKNVQTIYVCARVDNMTNPDDFENEKATMLEELKRDEFNQTLTDQGGALGIEYNDAAVKRYPAKKIKLD